MINHGLISKLKLRPSMNGAVISASEDLTQILSTSGAHLVTSLTGQFDWIMLFLRTTSDLEALLPATLAALKPTTLLWLAFPKGSSGMQTDLTRDRGWDTLKPTELKWINLVSINDEWSAFALRHFRPGEEKKSFR